MVGRLGPEARREARRRSQWLGERSWRARPVKGQNRRGEKAGLRGAAGLVNESGGIQDDTWFLA